MKNATKKTSKNIVEKKAIKVDKKTMEEVNAIYKREMELKNSVDVLVQTMSRYEAEILRKNKQAWKILKEKYQLEKEKRYAYDEETGEIVEVEED